jgi:hypothetical protein
MMSIKYGDEIIKHENMEYKNLLKLFCKQKYTYIRIWLFQQQKLTILTSIHRMPSFVRLF